jgi:chromosome segregation ATPase
MNAFPIVALVGLLAAIAFFLSARTAKAALAQRTAEEDKLRAELESARKAIGEARAEAKERREEATSLRAELTSTKKKAFEQAEAAKKAGGAAALRTEIDKLSTRLAEAREEAAHMGDRARAAEAAAEKQRQELERLRAQAERKVEQVAPAAVAAPTPAPAAPAGVEPEKLAAEKERADKAESKLQDARKRVAEMDKDLKAVRGRLETEKRVYMVQKGELELANDRHAELRRRFDALRKDHEELLDAVRQAAREERRQAETQQAAASPVEPSAGEKSAAHS